MKNQYFYLLFFTLTLVISCTKTPLEEDAESAILKKPETFSIIGGTPVATIADRPYQVGILTTNIGGGGVIIGAQWILTAAHVVDDATASEITVYAGSSTWGSGQSRTVDQIIIHNDYNNFLNFAKSDLALLHLSTPLNLDSTCSAIPYYDPFYNESYFHHPVSYHPLNFVNWDRPDLDAVVSGWGTTNAGSTFQLQSVNVKIVPNNHSSVKTIWPSSDLVLYTNSNDGQTRGICNGDSGGPLTVNISGYGEVLVGIANFGTDNCFNGASGYARISKFANWISSNTGIGIPRLYGEFDIPCGDQATFYTTGTPSSSGVIWSFSGAGFIGNLISYGHGATINRLMNGNGIIEASFAHYGNVVKIEREVKFGAEDRFIDGYYPEMSMGDQLSLSVEQQPGDQYYRWYVNDILVKQGSDATSFCTCSYEVQEPRVIGGNTLKLEVDLDCGSTQVTSYTFSVFSPYNP